jgi:hypothetical protein
LAGLAEDPLYAAPMGSGHTKQGIVLPQSGKILGRIAEDLAAMRDAVAEGVQAGLLDQGEPTRFETQAKAIGKNLIIKDDLLPEGLIGELSRLPHVATMRIEPRLYSGHSLRHCGQ